MAGNDGQNGNPGRGPGTVPGTESGQFQDHGSGKSSGKVSGQPVDRAQGRATAPATNQAPNRPPSRGLGRRRIAVTDRFAISEKDLSEDFVRASGPGGQNVNKVSTAVQLRFDLAGNDTLPEDVKARAGRLAGSRLTLAGEILIQADRFRTRDRNREDALERLVALLEKACERPKPRKATKPTLGSKKRRLETKKQRGEIKKMRGRSGAFD